MNKKEVNEIRRVLTRGDLAIREIYAAYVDAERNTLSFESLPLLKLSEEERDEYIKIFKKVLSRDIERKFLNFSFPNGENETRDLLYKIVKEDQVGDEVGEIFDGISSNFVNEAAYAILMARCSYDVENKASDGYSLEGSDRTYSFVITAICPIKFSKTSLAYQNSERSFTTASKDWLVANPDIGFIYPSFTSRQANVTELCYYVRNPKDFHDEIIEDFLGLKPAASSDEQKDIFTNLLETSFEGRLPLKSIVQINRTAKNYVKEREEEGETGPMASFEIEDMLVEAGSKSPKPSKDLELRAENIAEKRYEFKTEGIKIWVDEDRIDSLIESDVNGRKSLVIPLTDMTLNGIKLG